MAGLNILSIQVSLYDGIPRTAQPLNNRIVNKLSEKSNAVGSVALNYESSFNLMKTDTEINTLVMNYVRL